MDKDALVSGALSLGFSYAVLMDDLRLENEAGLRAYCNPEACPNHGMNWVCPPGCGSLEECAGRVAGYSRGILLQSVTDVGLAFSDYKALSRRHNLRLRELIENHCGGGGDVLALTSGGCIFCDKCAYPEPCVKPALRMHSLSAYGVDVGKLCEKAGLAYSFRPGRIYNVALVLF